MSGLERHEAPWWGDYGIDFGACAAFFVGPLELHVERDRRTWTLTYERIAEAARDRVLLRIPSPPPKPRDGAHVFRVAFRETHELLRIRPALPDRLLVVAPEIRFSIAPREDLTLYARVPVWLQVYAGDPPDLPALLREVMTERLQETWSGPSMREGDLAYATREDDFAPPEESAPAAHEVLCPLRIINRARSLLSLREIRIPLVHLALFADIRHQLWTPAVTLEREPDGDFAELRIAEGPPPEAESVVRVGDPRQPELQSKIVRVFGNLWRTTREAGE